jgi:hypothetical protein
MLLIVIAALGIALVVQQRRAARRGVEFIAELDGLREVLEASTGQVHKLEAERATMPRALSVMGGRRE